MKPGPRFVCVGLGERHSPHNAVGSGSFFFSNVNSPRSSEPLLSPIAGIVDACGVLPFADPAREDALGERVGHSALDSVGGRRQLRADDRSA